MTARLLDGKTMAATLRATLARKIARWTSLAARPPCLAVLLVGNHPASRSYVAAKGRACAETGIAARQINLPPTTPAPDILRTIHALNDDNTVDGILVQLPLPDPSIEQQILETIRPDKDVDGFHPLNAGRLSLGLPTLVPCTPAAILHILRTAAIPISGSHAVLIGRSRIVGRPLSLLLTQKGVDATLTLCHTHTQNLAHHTRRANLVIVASGHPHTLTPSMIQPGAVVIDVGINRIPDPSRPSGYRLIGDADFHDLLPIASAITPVPGGVGPMTIAMLLQNTLLAAARRTALPIPSLP